MRSIFELWKTAVLSVAVMAILVIVLGMMIRVIEHAHAFRHLAITLGCTVFLVMLPPIIVSIWRSLSFLQELGIITVAGVAGVIAFRGGKSRSRRKISGH